MTNPQKRPTAEWPTLAAGQFLVASNNRLMELSGSARSVVLILHHDETYTLGIDLTKTHNYFNYQAFAAAKDMSQLGSLMEEPKSFVYGGPLQCGIPDSQVVFSIIHDSKTGPEDAEALNQLKNVAFYNSAKHAPQAFEAYKGKDISYAKVAIGYLGWGPEQLQAEINDDAWVTMPGDFDLVFKTDPAKLWEICANRAGLNTKPPAPAMFVMPDNLKLQ